MKNADVIRLYFYDTAYLPFGSKNLKMHRSLYGGKLLINYETVLLRQVDKSYILNITLFCLLCEEENSSNMF
jgi:hypothetical protein